MTPQQQRIAIAEACGYVWHEGPPTKAGWWTDPQGYQVSWGGSKLDALEPVTGTDFLNDLNAMHEAEETLMEKQIRSYAFTLAQALDTSPNVDLNDQFLNIHATAAQRAEVFLRTLNLWKP
jgi:hypothetical protein